MQSSGNVAVQQVEDVQLPMQAPEALSQPVMDYAPLEQSAYITPQPMHQTILIRAPMQEEGERTGAIDKSKYKTKICRNWSSGLECPYGERCVFAHGEQERSTSLVTVSSGNLLRRTSSLVPLTHMASAPTQTVYIVPANQTYMSEERPLEETYSFTDAQSTIVDDASSTVYNTPSQQQLTPQQMALPGMQLSDMPLQVSASSSPGPSSYCSTPTLPAPFYRYEPYGADMVCVVPVGGQEEQAEHGPIFRLSDCSSDDALSEPHFTEEIEVAA